MSTGLRRKRRTTYTKEALTRAIEDVKSGATLNVTSRKYKIPRTTLHSRVTNKHSGRLGTKPALSDEDEADLARWVERMCAIGCSIGRGQIGDSVVLSLKASAKPNPFANGTPGKNWFDGFLRRRRLYEKVRENRRRSLRGVGVDGMNEWFAGLSDRLRTERLHVLSRTRIYSVGELSLPLRMKTSTWCLKEDGPTVLLGGNAAGQMVPPMIVFDSAMKDECDGKLPGGWSFAASENAEMSAEILYDYVRSHLYPWLTRNAVQLPVVLFLYQQLAAYLTQVLCDFCDEREIILAILPSSPHCATTPVEICVLPALRKEYTKKLKRFVQRRRSVTINKSEFVGRLKEVLSRTNLTVHLTNGFYKCGLYPLSAERYIRACIKLKPGEKIESSSRDEKQTEEAPVKDQTPVLKCIESSLDAETVEAFKASIGDLTWTGRVEDTSLFYFWRKITKSVLREGEQESEMESESDETDDEPAEFQLSDSGNENQENEGPMEYALDPKYCGGKHKPLSYINNNSDRNASIIVVNPNAFGQESDSD